MRISDWSSDVCSSDLGGTPMDILNMNLTKDGFRLTFTRPLADTVGNDPEAYSFIRYYYEYHQNYGSDRMDLQPVTVKEVDVSRHRSAVTLHLDTLAAGSLTELPLYRQISKKGFA